MRQLDLSNIDYQVAEAETCLHPKNRKLVDLWSASRAPDGLGDRAECYAPRMANELIGLHKRVLEKKTPVVLRGRFLGLKLEHVLFEAVFLPVRTEDGKLQVFAGMYDMGES